MGAGERPARLRVRRQRMRRPLCAAGASDALTGLTSPRLGGDRPRLSCHFDYTTFVNKCLKDPAPRRGVLFLCPDPFTVPVSAVRSPGNAA